VEITNLTEEGGKPADTLMNVVALIATRFRTDVCSAYLLEPDRSNLVLAATLGCIRDVSARCACRSTRGSAGLVAEQVLPVAVGRREEASALQVLQGVRRREYHSFLGVPLIDRGVLQGVLVVQTKEAARSFARTRFACWWRRPTRWRRW
jgi:signal transduction protein with GAF and PtsI domain